MTEAPLGQAMKHKSLLDQEDPAMMIISDSRKTTFFVFGFILFVSAIFSYKAITVTELTAQKIFPRDGL